jgi:hypothetical protein
MKPTERVEYMKNALGLCGTIVDDFTAELICDINDYLKNSKGNGRFRDVMKIKLNLIAKYEAIANNNLPPNE